MKRLLLYILTACLIGSCLTGCSYGKKKTKPKHGLIETSLGSLDDLSMVLDTCYDAAGNFSVLCIKNDGTIGLYLSSDNGTNWGGATSENTDLINDALPKDAYVTQGSIANTGDVLICYQQTEKVVPHIIYTKNGEVKQLELKGDSVVRGVRYLNAAKEIYVNRVNTLESYDTSGEQTSSISRKGILDFINVKSDIIVLSKDGLTAYDRATGVEHGKDTAVASKFKKELTKLSQEAQSTVRGSQHLLATDDEETLYFMMASGIYEHPFGNDLIISLLKGTHNEFSSADSEVLGYWVKDERHIRVLLGKDDAVTTYAYTLKKDAPKEVVKKEEKVIVSGDPDHPTGVVYKNGIYNLFGNYKTPYKAKKNNKLKGTLTVYSLYPDEVLKQAIKIYQVNHKNVDVELMIGIEEDSNQTVEGAAQALNTKLLSGAGPDVLILDGLDQKKYEENGLLKDISGLYETIQKEQSLFTNITDSYKEGKHMYAIPARFIPSVIVGEKKTVEQIKSLDDLAEVVEKDKAVRGNALNIFNTEQMMNSFYPTYSNRIVTKDGTYNEEELTAFVKPLKEIYERLSEQTKENHAEKMWKSFMEGREEGEIDPMSMAAFQLNELQITDYSHRSIGLTNLYRGERFLSLAACRRNKGYVYQASPLGDEGTFEARWITAISSKTQEEKLAEDFVKELFAPGEQFIKGISEVGCTVNREALRIDTEDSAGRVGAVFYDLEEVSRPYSLFYESQKEYDTYLSYVESFHTPSNPDRQVREIIEKDLDGYLKGKVTLEDYLDGVKKRMQVYQNE